MSFTVDDRIAEVWPISGVGFVLLPAVWGTSHRVVGATVAAMVVVTAVTALLLGHAATDGLWLGTTGVAQPLPMMLLYRRLRGGEGWAPRADRRTWPTCCAPRSCPRRWSVWSAPTRSCRSPISPPPC